VSVSRAALVRWAPGLVVLAILGVAPIVFSTYFLTAVLTQTLWLGLAAASLIFLAGYGGMVSLAQVGLYGIAGFTMGNFVLADGGSGIELNPWVGVILGLLVATGVGLVFGAVASRSEGIYFLMITLAFAVIVYFFWGSVTQLSGFGGLNNVDRPGIVGSRTTDPNNLFYVTLIGALGAYLLMRYLVRTPFGLTLQGIRDDPTRMSALGYNVALHRTLAFGFGAFVAGMAGILGVWWQTRIDPNSINIGQTLDVLVIAVVGGLYRLEGAWLGAFVFVLLDNYTRGTDLIGERFNTVIGLIFLVVVLLSPGGLIGIWARVTDQFRKLNAGRSGPAGPAPDVGA
jgi:branched-chain amino acid transport system permease protein